MSKTLDSLSQSDLDEFKHWLNLNLNNISWEGRYIEDFETFWNKLFSPGLSTKYQIEKIYRLKKSIKEGPLISWLKWLGDKFLCYIYINYNLSILELSELFNIHLSETAFILRNFFVAYYPELEEEFNDYFQVGNKLSEKRFLTYESFKSVLPAEGITYGTFNDEVMSDLEVTLYSEWEKIRDFDYERKVHTLETPRKKASYLNFSNQLKFLSELVILFSLGAALIFVIKVGSKWYEDYLVDKISLFEPNFFWLDKSLSYNTDSDIGKEGVGASLDEIEKLESLDAKVFLDNFEARRYDVESDVVLTSVDSLPRSFTTVDFEQSNYEENKKGGYRNNRYGLKRAYRVMMTSVKADEAKNKVKNILEKYSVKQVDNVKPGTQIPGGIYFNLYIPSDRLKEFFIDISAVEEATILESRTIFSGPEGTNRIFIWIKEI